MGGARYIIDYSDIDSGGAGLIISRGIQVLDSGVRRNGTVAWALTKIENEQVGFVSIYGPHPQEEKRTFFSWLAEFHSDGRWCFLGDWNMVLTPADSAGHTAVLKGLSREYWEHLDQTWDMTDVYHKAQKKEGPRFTRQVYRGGRLDQARLAGCTLTKEEDGSHRKSKKKRSSNIKFDVESFQDPRRKPIIVEAWNTGWELSPDPITAWDLAWGRVREVFRGFREEDMEQISNLKQKQQDLEAIRQLLAQGGSIDDIEDYTKLEREVKEAELLEARIIRRRSRAKWAKKGDVCSKYFFNTMKEKHTREAITGLRKDNGETVEDEEEMAEMIYDFYTELYTQPTITT
ncbi:hypothetical protein R1sor_009948 [Riccia sorocarpa]|uniref:Endonuclease/exonuclease/phosphatase domain-containing protein n=1 Tax=Riccia sorocarpa TaxID=122646 RepID=A0ABD3HZB1_9MARC